MHVRLIDANSVGYAQHHAQDVRMAGNMQTQAIAGMLQHVRRNLQYEPQTLNVLLWDGRAQWRYDILPTYKSGRHRTPEQRAERESYELQRPWIQRALRAFPVLQLTAPHAEADDLAFGLSRQLAGQGHLVSLFTADTDWLQLVAPRVRWINARKPAQVVELDGFARNCSFPAPELVASIKALAGDDSDDISGVPDIALKRATALVAKYGTLDAVLEAARDPFAFSNEPKYFQPLALPETQALVRRNERLVTLACGPSVCGDEVQWHAGSFDELELYEVFVDLGFLQFQDAFSLWERHLSKELPRADVLSVQRAIENLAQSWRGR